MNDWSAGYVHEVDYTFGCYQELNPIHARFALTMAGYHCPSIGTACELGFGQGVSINVHAASSDTEWWGTDFIPSQAAFARDLAEASGANTNLFSESFSDFDGIAGMPDFDFIGLHGVWSWVADEHRQQIIEFIEKKLKVGGILYCNYNMLPGWAGFVPLRNLMTRHSEFFGSKEQGTIDRIDGAIKFVETVLKSNPKFKLLNEEAVKKFEAIKGQPRAYLAHEFFNENWHPMDFTTIASCLSKSKVDFACSANLLDLVPNLNLSQPQQNIISEIKDPIFREIREILWSIQQHRRDYWVKGARRYNSADWPKACREQRVVLLSHAGDVEFKVTGELGVADVSEKLYAPILDFLADHEIKSIHEIEKAFTGKAIPFNQILKAIQMLAGTGHVSPAQDLNGNEKIIESSSKLNNVLKQKAKDSNDISFLSSPVTGGGVAVNRIENSFLRCLDSGVADPKEWAANAQALLKSKGEGLLSDGKTLRTDKEISQELNRMAKRFKRKNATNAESIKNRKLKLYKYYDFNSRSEFCKKLISARSE